MFKVGDKVRCVDSARAHPNTIEVGREYNVSAADPSTGNILLCVVASSLWQWFHSNRFQLVPERTRANIEAEIAKLQEELGKLPVKHVRYCRAFGPSLGYAGKTRQEVEAASTADGCKPSAIIRIEWTDGQFDE